MKKFSTQVLKQLVATPWTNPDAGFVAWPYNKSTDWLWYYLDSAGVEHSLATGSGGWTGWQRSKTAKSTWVVYQAWPAWWIIVFEANYLWWSVVSDANPTPTTVVWTWLVNWAGMTTVPILPNMYYQVNSSYWPIDFYEIGNVYSNNFGYVIQDSTMTGTTPLVITDTRISTQTPYNIYYTSNPVWHITRTLANWSLTLVSDNAANTMAIRIIFFEMGTGKQYAVWNQTLTWVWPRVISDARITTTTPVNIYPRTAPVWNVTAVSGAGTITISSTWTEVWVVVDYIVFFNSDSIIDWVMEDTTLNDADMFIRKDSVSGEDKSVKRSDMKTIIWAWDGMYTALSLSASPSVSASHQFTNWRVLVYWSISMATWDYARGGWVQISSDNSSWQTIYAAWWWSNWTISFSVVVPNNRYVRVYADYNSGYYWGASIYWYSNI